MSKSTDYIMVDGEKRPAHRPSDAYLMAEVWFGEAGSRDGSVVIMCDSHYGLRSLYNALLQVAEGTKTEPFSLDLLATNELIKLIKANPKAKECIPTLAKRLRIYPSSKADLFSLEFDMQDTLELYVGAEQARTFGDDLNLSHDTYPSTHGLWISGMYNRMVDPPHKQNALTSTLELMATWPGLHKSPQQAIKFEQNKP